MQTSEMPVRFALGTVRIDVAASRYGMRRNHLISADGSERRLDPAPGTPEYWRARLSRRHPDIGRTLAVGAIVVLATNLALFAPFVSPIRLPAWANTALTITTGLAGAERALAFRHHRAGRGG
ncbi:hypothetical protein ACIREO_21865 [Streptomyces sp. NPDC102441]|uniref:hypothetical protein n=1 Tax=Streptomyces sp. NPDC102441 TaxID=3366176 RepID=UPI00382B4D6E